MTAVNYDGFCQSLTKFVPESRQFRDDLHRLTYGTDASFYRLIPEVVVKVINEAEVIEVLRLAHQFNISVTFRAAGTSLSGQAVTDAVLVVLEGNSWRDFEILDGGNQIALQPGIIGAQVNKYLAPHGRKIGPDPASIGTAKIGGIAANNASGMCCGTAQNSYRTVEGMRMVMADGTVLDTRDEASRVAFAKSHTSLLQGLSDLSHQVKSNLVLLEKITHKFRLKNTTGYSLNALVDFDEPIEILEHLMIGSEGTLGFISEITYNTVPDYANKATALVLFPDVEAACNAVIALKKQPVDAVELMDRAGLRSVEDKPGMPEHLKTLGNDVAALLVDVRGETADSLADRIAQVQQCLGSQTLLMPAQFSTDPDEYARLWGIRKGLFPAVGAVREKGTTVIIEDVAFPIESLAKGTRELQTLFSKYNYDEAIIFGHALEGNLHFVFTQDFSTQAEVDRYSGFMHDVAELVAVKYGGSLKAEHGTGRNMAPFVELEWGKDAYLLMWALKKLCDPHNILNPGVVLNEDPEVHLKNLKPMPAANELVDSCIECGFCEPICPSRHLTLTPRQRIVAVREQARLEADGQDEAATAWAKSIDYDAIDTCAVDGLCATRCPVGINTGELMRELRTDRRGDRSKSVAAKAQQHMAGMTSATRVGLKSADLAYKVMGEKALGAVSRGMTKVTGGIVPTWHPYLPRSVKSVEPRITEDDAVNGKVVYFPSCVTRSMGTAENDDTETRDIRSVIDSLLFKAGFGAITPPSIDKLCCGLPFASMGFPDSAGSSIKQLEAVLWEASEQGKYPVLCDTSPCTLRMIEQFEKPMKLVETAGFIEQYLLPFLEISPKSEPIALHITCSARKMGLDATLRKLTNLCSGAVLEPEEEGCCGFGGDKGFTVPELNAASLARLKEQLPENCTQGVSNSRTCEIGLSLHSGRQYRSIAYLVDECASNEFTKTDEQVKELIAEA
ncbi:FAD-binding and (Fe-S)-binding domain-containing protein [Leucothrix arctica]|uniref:D-lactate dehydrogenase (cytochrome) n=1 Tax=Leucothrix arctica TaxID=1481894 RepID=A0A317CFN5_9GAMM|nr:FAD-binding and (Fe-S)-binding domain-containing protein [Leucothrix arctica]PWQ95150.1 4Fe-4S ferredoxin [Leucothrix arctica]